MTYGRGTDGVQESPTKLSPTLNPKLPTDGTVREGKASRYTGTEMTRLRLTQYGR